MKPTDAIGDDVRLYRGDCREVMAELAPGSVQSCITSPPYWGGLRDYGHPSQLGLERDPAKYVDELAWVFSDVRRLLREDGTLWLNLGDVYAASGKGGGGNAGKRECWSSVRERKGFRMPPDGYKMKDLTLVPFQVADRLRRDGWYLRQTVIWSKPSGVEPARADRPSSSHEYLFLFSKSEMYAAANPGEPWWNLSVWNIRADGDTEHPATMPRELARRCAACSSSPGDTILDPFAGSGTTGRVCAQLGRRFIGIELDEAHYATALRRLRHAAGRSPDQLFSVLE